MGLDIDLLGSDKASTADFADYQLVIVAPTSDREFKVDESLQQAVIDALNHGTSVLWIGGGIWGTFRTTSLPDAFGIRYVRQCSSTDLKVAGGSFVNMAGEADRLLWLFTRELGKVRAIAKGARKLRSRKAGHLEPFTRVALQLARGREWEFLDARHQP